MVESPEPPETAERTETESEIMAATYRALCEHGYASLTMQAIADEYGKTTAAIHYHYDTKEGLMVAFLEYLLDRFVEHVEEVETVEPAARLHDLAGQFLRDDPEYRDLVVAVIELRAQAPYDADLREQFKQNNEYIRALLRTVVEDGIEQGVFRDVDPEHVATACLTIVDGARARYVTLDEPDAIDDGRQTLEEYLESVVHVGRSDERTE
ncbi:TetR/AcrR family transcriptional regulator [Halocalculus aciditolerans]|uniref:HTH tetR-type domain-containing protein n=1 Tax=Halocalculus aciditolerans TaxID=1383812 RepID=A0A830FKT5_9EURY|nr:TetR/AcrR family transcriptional regulator [Halocalculus aciditolerans]GGL65752.1 hypothetical protein GCM10009039_24550 [Halocalculus aciditolerans]